MRALQLQSHLSCTWMEYVTSAKYDASLFDIFHASDLSIHESVGIGFANDLKGADIQAVICVLTSRSQHD